MRILLLIICLLSFAAQAGEGLIRLPWVEAPSFQLKDLQDKSHSLDAFRGQPLVINFWASWCTACVDEMPSLNRAWRSLQADNINLIAINMGESKEIAASFATKFKLEFPILLDTEQEVSDRWRIRGMPATYILDAEGKIVFRAFGSRVWDAPVLLNKIRSLNEQ